MRLHATFDKLEKNTSLSAWDRDLFPTLVYFYHRTQLSCSYWAKKYLRESHLGSWRRGGNLCRHSFVQRRKDKRRKDRLCRWFRGNPRHIGVNTKGRKNRGHSYIGNSGAVLRRSFTAAVSAVITCTYFSAISSSPHYYFPTISSRYVLYRMLRYLDVDGKNKWTVVRQVYGYCGYILLHKKCDSIYNECIYSTQSTRPSSITSVDIPREAPRKFVIGGGRTAGRIEGYFERSVAVGACRGIWGGLQRVWMPQHHLRWGVEIPGAPWACRGRRWWPTLAIMWCGCSTHDTGVSTRAAAGHVFSSRKVPA